MNEKKSGAVSIFIGLLLIVIFGVGLAVDNNPMALIRPHSYDFALEQFGTFCASVWLPAGIIGIPLSAILPDRAFSIPLLCREHRTNLIGM